MSGPLALVEGESDRVALLELAARLGRDLSGVEVRAMGGITNLGSHLTSADAAQHTVLLHDEGETAYVERTLARLDRDIPRFVCRADLEDELVRALGIPRALEVVDAGGDLASWEILTHQPFHRDRPEAAVLRRFWGTTSGRKEKYAGLLAAALEPDQAPAPLTGLLDALRAG
ncbi:ATP-dependent endonuclease [Nocardioides humilatus]|uniref:ATP-dependent endonuclease n=1 Tax=Nocardioides humilatus TaxID=2607660 RepID=A0A5B1L9R6_9ACTN|nr:ATP-dependent endonuclease [Nocardioides humilatus]KAA1417024.1 ATP-dependent endonuclease [Nocardioides humilatus]